ncbi:Co-chaperone [Savitreella phatthalungensis]
MVLHNPNNWHWTNKDCRSWAKSWFEGSLIGVSAEDGSTSVKIDKVKECTGDCDIAMRKGKIITIYDMKLVAGWAGRVGEEDVEGTITVPEFMHDADEDDLVYEVELFAETKDKAGARDLVRKKIVPQLTSLLLSFPDAMRDAHGKDVLIAFEQGRTPAAATAIPSSAPTQSTASSSTTTKTTTSSTRSSVNTSDISESYEFQTLASELYLVFVDPARVGAWTRGGAGTVVEAKEGGRFSLFAGNVEGTFEKLEDGKSLVQRWRLRDWPQSHYANLTLLFDQGLDGTNLRMTMQGIPIGAEDAVKANFLEYYVKPIKTTFGFGAVL